MLGTSLVVLALAAASTAGPVLSVVLTGADHFQGVENAIVSATVTNHGDEVARLLNHPTSILDKTDADTFLIANDKGVGPEFFGKHVKYIASPERSATTIAPGESVTVQHALGDAYDFTRSGAGVYNIDTSSFFTLVTDDGLKTIVANTTAHTAQLSGQLVKPEHVYTTPSAPPKVSRDVNPTFQNCTDLQQAITGGAAFWGDVYSGSAWGQLNEIDTHPATQDKYTLWFGTQTPDRLNRLKSAYFAMWGGNGFFFEGNRLTYDCSCTDNDKVAWVNKFQQQFINLCPPFWALKANGINSMGGTLIHEASHWTFFGNTVDNAIGELDCLALAGSDPEKAVSNADSLEYFAEHH